MSLTLQLQITADGSQAKRELSSVEHGISRVERAGGPAETSVRKLVGAIGDQSTETQKAAKSADALWDSTRKLTSAEVDQFLQLGQTKQLNKDVGDQLSVVDTQTKALTASRLASTSALTAGAAAVGSLLIVGAAELRFIYESSRAYLERSGILDQHAESIHGLKAAWDQLLFTSGQAIVGSGANFTSWIDTLTAGLIILGAEIRRRIDEFRELLGWINFVGTGGMSFFDRGAPTPANSLVNADGTPTAAGYLKRQQERQAAELRMMSPTTALYGTSLDAETAQRDFDKQEADAKRLADKRTREYESWLDGIARSARQFIKPLAARTAEQLISALPVNLFNPFGGTVGDQIPLLRRSVLPSAMVPAWAVMPIEIDGLDLAIMRAQRNIGPVQQQGFYPWEQLPGTPVGPLSVPKAPSLFSQMFGPWFDGGMFRAPEGQQLSGVARGVNFAANAGSFGLSLLDMFGLSNSRGGQALNMGLQGMSMGSMFGPWGALIGGIGGGIASLFGPTAYEKREREANTSIAEMVRGLESRFGGREGTAFLANALGGIDWETARGWRGAGSLEPLGDTVNQISGRATEGLNKILNEALKTGKAFPAALAPALEELIRMGALTTQNANLLRGLPENGVPSFAQIQQAAAALNVEIQDLGPAVQQIRLKEEADEATKAMEILRDAGVDMGTVIQVSAKRVQDLVNQSITMGLKLPDSLKPWVQSMIDAGLLVDATGQKLTDVGQLNWADPVKEGIDGLIEALHELIATLKDDIPAAANAARDGWNTAVDGIHQFPKPGQPGDGGDDELPQPHPGPTAHFGGLITPHSVLRMHTGGEVPIIAQAGEYMMQRSAVQRYGRSFMHDVNNGRFANTTRPIVVHHKSVIKLDKYVVGEAVSEILAQ